MGASFPDAARIPLEEGVPVAKSSHHTSVQMFQHCDALVSDMR